MNVSRRSQGIFWYNENMIYPDEIDVIPALILALAATIGYVLMTLKEKGKK